MDFSLSEAEVALRDLAARIMGDQATPVRRRAGELAAASGGTGVDGELWAALAGAGLLAAFIDGHETDADRPGVVAAALVCRELGAAVAPIPLWTTLAALLALRGNQSEAAAAGRDAVAAGAGWATIAYGELGGTGLRWSPVMADGDGLLTGTVVAVPDLPGASWVLVEANDADEPALYWLDLDVPGVDVRHVITTNRRAAGHLHLDRAGAVRVGGAAEAAVARQIAATLVCATQAGVCAQAITDTAAYLGARHQFGRPLASFQAPVHRLVDSFIDTDAIWLTTLLAAWRLDNGIDAAAAVDVARWWAADAGNRTVHTTQHLHGGIGADVDYPIHRHFLWAKQLGDTLGGAAAHAAHLGSLIASGADL